MCVEERFDTPSVAWAVGRDTWTRGAPVPAPIFPRCPRQCAADKSPLLPRNAHGLSANRRQPPHGRRRGVAALFVPGGPIRAAMVERGSASTPHRQFYSRGHWRHPKSAISRAAAAKRLPSARKEDTTPHLGPPAPCYSIPAVYPGSTPTCSSDAPDKCPAGDQSARQRRQPGKIVNKTLYNSRRLNVRTCLIFFGTANRPRARGTLQSQCSSYTGLPARNRLPCSTPSTLERGVTAAVSEGVRMRPPAQIASDKRPTSIAAGNRHGALRNLCAAPAPLAGVAQLAVPWGARHAARTDAGPTTVPRR